ncbi:MULTISPECIES: GNAT family N-acetyltransferase [Enterococcus]|uniref:GNAT family N-acetyltransferase n=1 Tax=Enterococcus TaxID=1350 RepID=UPI000ECDFDD6|nr:MULTISPECIES: GNAT family N-acetyltransferase [Enterococcus]HCM87416.1 GNAT family N-acetyltransferase [Enterococcus sp.]
MIKLIDQLSSTDLQAIAQIWLKSNIEAHDFISKEYWHNNYQFVLNSFPSATIYAYYHDKKIVGFLGLIDEYIAGIFVLYEYRSLGIGTQLLEEAQSDHTQLTLNVYKKNENAVQFYLKKEFTIQEQKLDAETNEIELSMKWQRS